MSPCPIYKYSSLYGLINTPADRQSEINPTKGESSNSEGVGQECIHNLKRYTHWQRSIIRWVRMRWRPVAQMEAETLLLMMCRWSAEGASCRVGPGAGSMGLRLGEQRGNAHKGHGIRSLRIGDASSLHKSTTPGHGNVQCAYHSHNLVSSLHKNCSWAKYLLLSKKAQFQRLSC